MPTGQLTPTHAHTTKPGTSGTFSWLREDVTQAVGMVPTVSLHHLHPVCSTHFCHIKLESCNPGGSIKEKNAVYLVDYAESDGLLRPGGTIIESSSGNFGIGLAIVGAARGYRVIIVVDAKTAPPMRRTLLAYGAELVDVPLHEADASGSMQKARMRKAQELAENIPNAWYPCQHLNPVNTEAHAVYTAQEIEATFGNSLDAVVVGVSTAGQIMGIAKQLKQRHRNLKIIGVDVEGSVIMGTPAKPYKMTGVGLSFTPPNLDYGLLDQGYVVPESLSYTVCHALAKREGLLLGASTGAIVAAGLHFASQMPAGSRILMINPDRGDRYLETIYDTEWLAQNGFEIYDFDSLPSHIDQLKPTLG